MSTKSSPARTANPAGLRTNGNWSVAPAFYFARREFPTRPLPVSSLLTDIGRDVSSLFDAHAEAENNLVRGEEHFLRLNLRACFALAKRIQSRHKAATRLLAKTKGTHA